MKRHNTQELKQSAKTQYFARDRANSKSNGNGIVLRLKRSIVIQLRPIENQIRISDFEN